MPPAVLSDREKMALRNVYLRKKAIRCGKEKQSPVERTILTKKVTMRELLRLGNKAVLVDRLLWKSARAVIRNFSTRVFAPISIESALFVEIIPMNVWHELLLFERMTTKEMCKYQKRSERLEGILGNAEQSQTSGLVKNISDVRDKCVLQLSNICARLARSLLSSAIRKSEKDLSWVLQEFDLNQQALPLNTSLVVYEEEKTQGICEHIDANAMFMVAICVLRESGHGNLELDDMDLKGPIPDRSILFISPSTHHEVPFVKRSERRSVLVFTF